MRNTFRQITSIIRRNYPCILLFIFILGCSTKPDKAAPINEASNELINEGSPYLIAHADNPVDWYPWGDKALDKAHAENKLVIISIGYSACHWCHVMEKESFEDTLVANFMNKHFISIKVDSEQRPDIDQQYMDACIAMTGSGGWPLNVIALPDGRPFYAGTYFEKEEWLEVLSHFVALQRDHLDQIELAAEQVSKSINPFDFTLTSTDSKFPIGTSKASFDQFALPFFDLQHGGIQGAPKFPLAPFWEFALQLDQDDTISGIATTLNQMAKGGIYDHVGGGFSRYSTDKFWQVPHFEKMLYDNAQLVSLYSHTYQKNRNPFYKRVITETLQFIQREMTSEDGAFYTSIDADSEGKEGAYYLWSKKELEIELGKEASFFFHHFDIRPSGNWNGKNIIWVKEKSSLKEMYSPSFNKRMNRCKNILLSARAKRIPPKCDQKILTSWNALMLHGYIDAYRALGTEEYREAAIKNAQFISQEMLSEEGKLQRNYLNEMASIDAFLGDYASVIAAFIDLYQITFDEQWLDKAKLLTNYVNTHFSDEDSKLYHFIDKTSGKILHRGMELTDQPFPSSNAVMAENLLLLGTILNNSEYQQRSKQMVSSVEKEILKNPLSYGKWMQVRLLLETNLFEVAIVGKNFKEEQQKMLRNYLPNTVLMGGEKEGSLGLLRGKLQKQKGKTMIYVCQNRVCQKPVESVQEALEQMR